MGAGRMATDDPSPGTSRHLEQATHGVPYHAFLGFLALAILGCSNAPAGHVRSSYESGVAASSTDPEAAVAEFTKAIESSRDEIFFAKAHLGRSECRLAMARSASDPEVRNRTLDLALEDADLVLGRSDFVPEDRARALTLRGKALLERGDPAGAEAAFQGILGVELDEPAIRDYRLEAHRQLGWIFFRRAETSGARASGRDEIETRERFREAQEQFSSGLQIDDADGECNMGKGMCLHFRKQDAEAIAYLDKAIAAGEAARRPNPRAHYFLGRAMESQKGFYGKALDHYRRAVEQDAARSHAEIYWHLLNVLPVYLGPEDEDFGWFLDAILAHNGNDDAYWKAVEGFATKLIDGEGGRGKEAGVFARALARARSGRVEEAVADALLLASRPDFTTLLARIFPADASRPDYFYGRAMTLLGARRHEDLERFFESEGFRAQAASSPENDYCQKTLALEGKNIVARWLEESAREGPVTTPEARLERDRALGKARDAFQKYLEKHPQDHGIRMALGELLEHMESFSAAYASYAFIASAVKDHPAALRRILRLHRENLLPEKVKQEAWDLLRESGAGDPEVAAYVQKTRTSIESDLRLYCAQCGRKAAEGEAMCPECGRRLGGK